MVLEPDDFALSNGEPDPPPSDLIDPEVWHGILDLPDDVSIRTSDHHGTALAEMYRLWGAWIESIGDTQDLLFDSMLDAMDEYQAFIFNMLHGYYRQAVGSMRNALELVAIGASCQVANKSSDFKSWRAGEVELAFGSACDILGASSVGRRIDDRLASIAGDSLFRQRTQTSPGGWARRLWRNLSDFAHSRPAFTNADMWQSNGPIYTSVAFRLVCDHFYETMALSYLMVRLARPSAELPKPAEALLLRVESPWRVLARHAHSALSALDSGRGHHT